MEKKEIPKQFAIYLPKTWEDDLVLKLRDFPPDFKCQHIDYFKYIGQLPYHVASKLKDVDYENGFVPIQKSRLAKRIHDYRKYLNYLLEHKFLEEDRYYEAGSFSAGLRYPAKYIKQKSIKTVLRKQTLIKNLLSRASESHDHSENIFTEEANINHYPYLTKWIPELTIDSKKAYEILDEVLAAERLNPEKHKPKIKKWRHGQKKVRKHKRRPDNFDHIGFRYNLRGIMIDKIKRGEYFQTGVDKTAGRFHSFLTRIKKELRSSITYKDQKLIAVDIKNSQPFDLIAILDPYVFCNNSIDLKIFGYNDNLESKISSFIYKWENNQNNSNKIGGLQHRSYNNSKVTNDNNEFGRTNSYIYSIDFSDVNVINSTNNTIDYIVINNNDHHINNTISNKINNDYCLINSLNEQSSTTMIVNFISQLFDNEDVKKYIDWVVAGNFYEKFGDELFDRKLIPNDCPNRRDAAKDITFHILFGKNDSEKRVKKAVKAFREVFPSVFAITEMVKFGDREDRPHSSLACTMQAFEAELVLQHCCGTIAYERPDLPIFTIHDSIVTTVGNEHYVQEVMERTFNAIVGYVPKFKFEPWY